MSSSHTLTSLPDLHRHLDGSMRAQTLSALAEERGVTLPDADLRFRAGMTLREALGRFEVTLSVLQDPDAVSRVASEMCEDAVAEGVSTLEVRFAPQLHGGAPLEEIVDAALDGLGGRAGLILCLLYGQSPVLAQRLVDVAIPRPGVVGLDLAGGPTPTDAHRMAEYASAFGRAREQGLGITVHAGEGGRPPAEIRVAIEQLGAQRIGHACSLLSDTSVVDLVLERGVTLEACPTSNVQTGAIARVEDHPLPRWLDLGISATVCTDNTFLSDVDAPEEHRRAASIPQMTPERLRQTVAAGHAAAFRR